MKFLLMFLLPILIISSCSSTIFIKKDDTSIKKINEVLQGEEVTITLLSGEEITAENVVLKQDITITEKGEIATNTIKEMNIRNHGTGALKGFAYSGLPVLALTTAWYLSNVDEPYADFIFIYPIISSTLGVIFGAIHGDVKKFIFPFKKEQIESSSKKVEVSEFLEVKLKYIIVLYQSERILLEKSEYINMISSPDGKKYVTVPEYVFLDKFITNK